MALTEIINSFNSDYRKDLNEAIKLNNRVSFYSELQTNIKEHPYYNDFKEQLHALYNNIYKEDIFVNAYLGKNLPSVELIETIWGKLKDVFDSQNGILEFDVQGKNSKELSNEISEYFDYFKNNGWQALKTKFNSFIIVDIDKDKKPYIYNVAPNFVKYFDLDADENLKEIIFTFDNKVFYYYTDTFYSVYIKENNNYTAIVEPSNHNLNRFPGNIFFNDRLNSYSEILSKNIVYTQLDDIHLYVIKHTELLMNELAMSNVTKVMPDKSCGYEINDIICKGGRLFNTDVHLEGGGQPILDTSGTQKLCPVCGVNRHIGTGAAFTVDYEKLAEAGIKVDDLIKYFAPPLEGTQYQFDRLKDLKKNIIDSAVGYIRKESKEARNVEDVTSDYESATKILTAFGYTLSVTIQDTFDVILKLKYGKKYKSNSVFLGNKFYLLTKTEMIEEKKQSTNPIDRTEIELKILNYDYKHDKQKLNSILEAYKLLPYSGLTDVDFFELIKLNKVSDFDIELRTNINYYINKFVEIKKNSFSTMDSKLIWKTIEPLVYEKLKKNESVENTDDLQDNNIIEKIQSDEQSQ